MQIHKGGIKLVEYFGSSMPKFVALVTQIGLHCKSFLQAKVLKMKSNASEAF
jgi:hypothetical protein